MRIDSSFFKTTTVTLAALAISACGGSDSSGSSTPDKALAGGNAVSLYEVDGDHAIGSKDASVVVVEYASVVCPACASWHNAVYPEFREKYVETGKVRYIFREFPTSPERLAYAGFTIANCADESKFLKNIAIQFKRQKALLYAQDPGKAYEELAKASGLSVKEYEACLVDPEWKAEYDDGLKAAREAGVNSTPSFFFNGKQKKAFKIEDFDEILAPLLGETMTKEPAE